MSVLETYGGHYFDYLDPQVDQIYLDDIAHALSNTCRFGGHTLRFYSVAEHAAFVGHLVFEASGIKQLALAGLHHDSHEAYLGDIPTPLKTDLGGTYRELVASADFAIGKRFGIMPCDFKAIPVHDADQLALRLEARELKVSRGVGPHWGHDRPPRHGLPWRIGLDPWDARQLFTHLHRVWGGR